MEIKRSGSQPSGRRPASYFTGEMRRQGAAARPAMTHIAIQEKLDGKTVQWQEQVADEQYRC